MDRSELARLYSAAGPVTTVYLDTPSDVPDAAERLALTWKNTARELADSGVDEATVAALDDAVGAHSDGGWRVLVASGGQVHLALSLPGRADHTAVHVGALPMLRPLIEQSARLLPHLVVLTDRHGADLLAYTADPEAAGTPVEGSTVTGRTLHTRKVSSGGWSMRHMQAHAQEGWEHNAAQVADAIDRLARTTSPRLVIAAGDTRALELVHEALPEALKPHWRTVAGGRSEDGSAHAVAEEVLGVLDDAVTADAIDLLERFSQNRGRRELASDGAAATVEALRRAQVDILLLTDVLDDGATAWFGADPAVLALHREELDGIDDAPQEAPLVDVLLRAALGTDAQIAFVPGGPEQAPTAGVGALLRYSTP